MNVRVHLARYSFGSTSAIITNLALITALNTAVDARKSIIGGLLVIALADNISDSLGIHIYQESKDSKTSEVWLSTATNFLSRLLVSSIFILIIATVASTTAVVLSLLYGLIVLAAISFIIAKQRGKNPYLSVLEHLSLATLVITVSKYLGGAILMSL